MWDEFLERKAQRGIFPEILVLNLLTSEVMVKGLGDPDSENFALFAEDSARSRADVYQQLLLNQMSIMMALLTPEAREMIRDKMAKVHKEGNRWVIG